MPNKISNKILTNKLGGSGAQILENLKIMKTLEFMVFADNYGNSTGYGIYG